MIQNTILCDISTNIYTFKLKFTTRHLFTKNYRAEFQIIYHTLLSITFSSSFFWAVNWAIFFVSSNHFSMWHGFIWQRTLWVSAAETRSRSDPVLAKIFPFALHTQPPPTPIWTPHNNKKATVKLKLPLNSTTVTP